MDNWVEQVLGAVIRPLNDEHGGHIHWMWMTRYILPLNGLPGNVTSHFATEPIPESFLIQEPNRYRYVLFRLSADDAQRQQIHNAALQLAKGAGFYSVPWVDYDVVGDLGNNRFIHDAASENERIERARLVANFIDATLRLMLHSLVEEDGQWKLEPNSDTTQNPKGSFFQSVHHLFCNATNVPLSIRLSIQPSPIPLPIEFPVKF
jgi:hypothetical protein